MTARRYRMFLLFAALILLFFCIALVTASFAFLNNNRIAYGVESHGIVLSGLTPASAEEKLAAYCQKNFSGQVLSLTYNDRCWRVAAADIDLQTDPAATAAEAYSIGRSGNIAVNLWQSIVTAWRGRSIRLAVTYDEARLQNILQQIAQSVNEPSANARCELKSNGQIERIPEKTGKNLTINDFATVLRTNLLALNLPQSVALPVEASAPAIRNSDLQAIDSVLSSYSTHFNSGNFNRTQNIRIGAESINGSLVPPEQILSFNDTAGHRVAAAGYKEAPVIIDGETVPGIGGGICQVSSTLYNAVLLANLKSVERNVHFYPSSYVPIGFDATVADDLLDFKFQNTGKHNLYILTEVIGDTLTIYILGNKSDRPAYQLALDSVTDKIIPPETVIHYSNDLPRGVRRIESNGSNGYIVSAYRRKLQNGQEIGRELLHRDEYSAQDRILLVGTH